MQRIQTDEGAQQGHRYHQRGDDGGPDILQEDQHHQEHQRDRLDQRVHHVGNRGDDERCGVVRHVPLHAGWQILGQDPHFRLHRLGHGKCVGARQQEQAQAAGRFVFVDSRVTVALRSERNARNVAQAHHRAIALGEQDDVAELLQRGKQRIGRDRSRELLALDRWIGAQRTGSELRVLGTDGAQNLRSREPIALQLVRIEPDANGVFRTELERIADAVDAGHHGLNLRGDDIGEAGRVNRGIVRGQTDEHQDVGAGLGHHHTLLNHRGGQQWLGQGDLVLYLHLSDVRIGAGGEGQGDRAVAVGVG